MIRGRVVVLSGAGISAESGLQTFRGAEGLWEGHSVYEVATPEAWERDPETVLRFYNHRRRQVREARPNAAHRALAALEKQVPVKVITQNVDDLHERAGSNVVLHLHGEIRKARSSIDPDWVVDLGDRDIERGDCCPEGGQFRPHVVWFGEAVPNIETAAEWVAEADILLVVGTSLNVYPAAGLVDLVRPGGRIVVVNPEMPQGVRTTGIEVVEEPATVGVPRLVAQWTEA
ncbi:MAG: NAD-dependent deacylase [Oceanipulchritudo sp.]